MRRGGFTLVELIVALTLMSALVSGLFYSFGQALRSWRRINDDAAHLQIQSLVNERLCRDIRSGAILASSNSAEVFLKIGAETVSYRLITSKVRRKSGSVSAYLTMDSEIKKLSFAYPSPGAVSVCLDGLTYLAVGRNQ